MNTGADLMMRPFVPLRSWGPAIRPVKPKIRLPGSPFRETGAMSSMKPNSPMRPSSPATVPLKPMLTVPGSLFAYGATYARHETKQTHAAAAA